MFGRRAYSIESRYVAFAVTGRHPWVRSRWQRSSSGSGSGWQPPGRAHAWADDRVNLSRAPRLTRRSWLGALRWMPRWPSGRRQHAELPHEMAGVPVDPVMHGFAVLNSTD